MKCIYLLFLLLPISLSAQIESGKKNKKQPKSVQQDTAGTLLPYFHGSFGKSFRLLAANTTDFGKDPGERVNETSINVKGFQLGVLSQLKKGFKLDIGLAWVNYGEQYERKVVDTTFSYTNTYASVALPFRIQYEIGNKVVFFVGTGLQPQLLSKYRHTEVLNIKENKTETSDKADPTLNLMNIASTSTIGVRLQFMTHLQFLLAGDYALQLNNSYNKQGAYKHQPWSMNFRIGACWRF